MFTYLKMKNFKSFKEISIDLQNKKDEFKHIIAIYGANGSGKSTIVEAFLTLEKTLGTMRVKDMLLDLLNNKITPPDDIPIKQEMMLEFIKTRLASSTVEKIIDEYKMINTTEPMMLEFGFIINGSTGSYLMEFDNSDLIRERLEYKILKNRGCCFDIEEDKVEINSNIFESAEFLEEIKRQIQMYWGKHTFLSILQHEMDDKSATYVNSNISPNLMNILTEFNSISYKTASNREDNSIYASPVFANLEGGTIEKSEEKNLDKIEQFINEFFISLFDDVNKAFYHREEKNGKIRYSLFLNKRIDALDFDIDFRYESSGTQEILNLLPYLMVAITGKCVIIDEKSEEKNLDKIEQFINEFFISLFDDVNKAFYHREEKNGKIRYSLFLNKRIDALDFDIDFRYESSGTQEILNLLPYLMVAITGKCVIIDEFGNGIHDLMAAKLMKAVSQNIKGQLIITTHNTLIMDHSNIKPDALYFIFNGLEGKKVKCVTDVEERLHPNYNYRNRYFNNELYADGLPKNADFDFSEFAKLYG